MCRSTYEDNNGIEEGPKRRNTKNLDEGQETELNDEQLKCLALSFLGRYYEKTEKQDKGEKGKEDRKAGRQEAGRKRGRKEGVGKEGAMG